MKPKVTIITPVMNKLEFTSQMLEELAKTTKDWPYEVVIVDNCSSDGTSAWIKNSKLPLNGRIIKNEQNKGFSVANNQGYGISRGDLLCFLNNDIIPTQGWLSALCDTLLSDEKIGIVGARLLHPGRGSVQHAGIDVVDLRPNHTYFGRQQDDKDVMKQRECFAVTGACMLIRKSTFEELNGFSEDYWLGFEDIDLCNKAKEKGYKIVYEPRAKLYHYESRTPGRYEKDDENFKLYMHRWVYGNKEYGY